jgi:CubicO group peptidase (beta-lactamase class C family)
MRDTRHLRILPTLVMCAVIGRGAAPVVAQTPPEAAKAAQAGSTAPTDDLSAKLAAIEKVVDSRRRRLHVPGASLVIVKDDRVIYLKGLGFRDVAQRLPVTPKTVFAIGSATKAFTAMTVMMSADDGKLSLEDSPKKYLPYFKLRDPEADSKITISDLLCHRSGLDRTDISWYTGVLRPREVIQVAGLAKPTAKYGAKWQYQNFMFLVAGEVVAKVQKSPWRKVVARRIFRPLGMKATNTSVRETQRAPDYALGYNYDEETKQTVRLPMRDLSTIAPAGAINSNAEEMAQWLRLMLGGGVFAGKRLVSEKGFNELIAPHMKMVGSMSYGYGWILRQWHGHRVVEHGGNIDGFNAEVALMPDQKLGLVLLTNISASPLGMTAMDAVWENLVGQPPDPPAAAAEAGAGTAPDVEPAAESGTYQLAEENIDLAVDFKEGKLTVQVPGQPVCALERVSGRRYRIAPPAPPNSYVTFRPSQKDPQAAEMLLEQAGGSLTVVLPKTVAAGGQAIDKPAAFTAPISVEELMRKVIEAAGGEANLGKHRTMVTEYDLDFENQGLTGRGVVSARAPNATAERMTLFGLGKKIGWIREYFDGTRGGAETSFSPASVKSGQQLTDAAISADFAPELNWKKLFKSVTIKGITKVGDEETYEVEKKPEKGSAVTDYISTKSFLLIKRVETVVVPGAGGSLPVSETLSDYRPVDGVMVPFRHERAIPEMGDTVLTVRSVKFDVRIADAVFRPGAKK